MAILSDQVYSDTLHQLPKAKILHNHNSSLNSEYTIVCQVYCCRQYKRPHRRAIAQTW